MVDLLFGGTTKNTQTSHQSSQRLFPPQGLLIWPPISETVEEALAIDQGTNKTMWYKARNEE
jgi:hypothetical protein